MEVQRRRKKGRSLDRVRGDIKVKGLSGGENMTKLHEGVHLQTSTPHNRENKMNRKDRIICNTSIFCFHLKYPVSTLRCVCRCSSRSWTVVSRWWPR